MPGVVFDKEQQAQRFVDFFLQSCTDDLDEAEKLQHKVFKALLDSIIDCRDYYSGGIGAILVAFRFRTSVPRIAEFQEKIAAYRKGVPLESELMCDLVQEVISHISFGRWNPNSSANMYFLTPLLARINDKRDDPSFINQATEFLANKDDREAFLSAVKWLLSKKRADLARATRVVSQAPASHLSQSIKFSSSEEERSCESYSSASESDEPEEQELPAPMLESVYDPGKAWDNFLSGRMRSRKTP